MSRRTAGIGLIIAASVVYSARVIATAILTQQFSNVDSQVFGNYLAYTDQGISLLSGLAIIAGIGYLVWAEVAENRHREGI